ncbi:SRPBCC family protein [Arthrobacter russicus]|jgi:hypothetical protein|uniref:ATPase n=1 Tax=Arthrobacter russicus TaxID=172040 RepID=A0ABU1J7Z3_9MICC|nr:SRPBCC domain-containing protein [Arthrobacter russicus]MDR6267976.1 hypothetical protein [Arthrobacter russicus]
MSRKFDVNTEAVANGRPEQVWAAVVAGGSGWQWPAEVEPRLGGAGPFGSEVTAWQPPNHFGIEMTGPDGFFNILDYVFEELPDESTRVRYRHSGIFLTEMSDDEWANQYDGVRLHTAFYLHTLGQYVQYFAGRQAAFADVQGPDASGSAQAFEVLKQAIGAEQQGQQISFEVPGIGTIAGELDYLTEHFAGVRTANAMYRFFGRNAFGQVVGMTIHEFGEAAEVHDAQWQEWLAGLY